MLSENTSWFYRCSVSPDGNYLASASMDHSIGLWEMQTGKLVARLLGHTGIATAAIFHPDGTGLASTSMDQTIRLWDTHNLLALEQIQTREQYQLLLRRSLRYFGTGQEEIHLIAENHPTLTAMGGRFSRPPVDGVSKAPRSKDVSLIEYLVKGL